jgi:hypothetical protein
MTRKLYCCGQPIVVEFIPWSEYSITIDGDEITALYKSQGGLCVTKESALKVLSLLK